MKLLILAVVTLIVAIGSFFGATVLLSRLGASPVMLTSDLALKRQLDAIEARVAGLLQAGCKPLELSFEAPALAKHRLAQTRPECRVFGEDGPIYSQLGPGLLNPKGNGQPSFGHMTFSFANDVDGLGQQPCKLDQNHAQCNDLIVLLPYLSQATCTVINRLGGVVGKSPTIAPLTASGTINLIPFTGTVDGQQTIGGQFKGRLFGCGAVQWMHFPPSVEQAGFVGYRVLVLR